MNKLVQFSKDKIEILHRFISLLVYSFTSWVIRYSQIRRGMVRFFIL